MDHRTEIMSYGPLFLVFLGECAVVLWTVVLGYVPLSRSMSRCLVLCAFVSVYEPLFRSMGLRSALCAVLPIYGPSFWSMCRHLALCAVISPYVPSSHSMCLHSNLCAILPIYGLSTAFYVPTSDRNPLHDIRQPPHLHQKRKHQLPFLCFLFYFY